MVGANVGALVGFGVGPWVGFGVGPWVGPGVGPLVGDGVGPGVGVFVGDGGVKEETKQAIREAKWDGLLFFYSGHGKEDSIICSDGKPLSIDYDIFRHLSVVYCK